MPKIVLKIVFVFLHYSTNIFITNYDIFSHQYFVFSYDTFDEQVFVICNKIRIYGVVPIAYY